MNNLVRMSNGVSVAAGSLALFMGVTNVRAADDSMIIAEIIVTAQKRSENLQDVPASVSVFSEEQLSRVHATQLADFVTYLPGISVASGGSPGQTTITLRGIAPIGPGAVVGTYIDDTPLGSSSNYAAASALALDMLPYDIERVEVLRGPQGTLYGAGSMGGLLKYVMRDPSTDGLEFRAGIEGSDVSGAGDPGWGARAGANIPLGETVALRASYFTQTTPGYIDNVYADDFRSGQQDENEVEQTGGRAALLWQASDNVSVSVQGVWQRLDSDNNSTQTLALSAIDPPQVRRDLGDLQASHPIPQTFSKDVDYYSATLNWNLGWGEFVSASSYSTTKTAQQQDATIPFGSAFGGLSTLNVTFDLDKWTQEFRLASTGDDKIEWRLGVFYTDEDSQNVQLADATDLQGVLIPDFAPWFATTSLPSEYQEVAVFGDVTFKFNEAFDLITGVRWAANEQKFRQITGGAVLATSNILGESDEDVFTYAVSPRWHVDKDTMVYLRVASGYRPGGPNLLLPQVPPTVDSDELTNYELGLKTQFLDGRALINAAMFYIDWEGIQQVRSFAGITALDNAGDVESKGAEIESVFAITNRLLLGLNVSYTDATLETSPPDLGNLLGAMLPLVPEWTAALTADYSFTVFGGRAAHVGAGWRYVDERESQLVTIQNNLSYVLPEYDVVDLNADVRLDPVTVRFFVRNLTDERGYTGGGTLSDATGTPVRVDANVLQPRTVGFSLDFQF